jgi:NADH-quinone oxidoreductase subunit J
MTFELFCFYVFSTVLVSSAIMVVASRNAIFSALFLVLAFFSCAGVWMLLEAEFLAITLVLVYVGAVMVLFLFVVMMLDVNTEPLKEGFMRYLPVGIAIGVAILVEMIMVVGTKHFGADKIAIPARHAADYSNTEELGRVLYTTHLFAFELAAVILVVAIIAAISLTLRKRPQTRYQDPSKQVLVQPEDRMRVVKMASEDRESQL